MCRIGRSRLHFLAVGIGPKLVQEIFGGKPWGARPDWVGRCRLYGCHDCPTRYAISKLTANAGIKK